MYKINNNQHDNSMITNYKVNKNELVLNIKLEDFNLKKSNITLFCQLINNLLITKKIRFYGYKIIIYVNGISIGYFYLSKFYLKKLYIAKHLVFIDNTNSYFIPNKIIEIKNNILRERDIVY